MLRDIQADCWVKKRGMIMENEYIRRVFDAWRGVFRGGPGMGNNLVVKVHYF